MKHNCLQQSHCRVWQNLQDSTFEMKQILQHKVVTTKFDNTLSTQPWAANKQTKELRKVVAMPKML